MVVVGPLRSAIQAVATASESKLSARRAVADIGFEQTLGPRNVYEGTDVHKLFLKEAYGGGRLDDEVAPLWEALGRALRRELAPWAIGVSLVEPAFVESQIHGKVEASSTSRPGSIAPEAYERYAPVLALRQAMSAKNIPLASPATVTSAAVCPPRCQSTATLTVPLPRTMTSTRPSCGFVALPLDLTGAVGEYPPERPARWSICGRQRRLKIRSDRRRTDA